MFSFSWIIIMLLKKCTYLFFSQLTMIKQKKNVILPVETMFSLLKKKTRVPAIIENERKREKNTSERKKMFI